MRRRGFLESDGRRPIGREGCAIGVTLGNQSIHDWISLLLSRLEYHTITRNDQGAAECAYYSVLVIQTSFPRGASPNSSGIEETTHFLEAINLLCTTDQSTNS
jgi:hypothetical protein